MSETCNVIRDLIPAVKSGTASKESARRVKQHIADCDACREAYEAYAPPWGLQFLHKRKRDARFLLKLLGAAVLVAMGLSGSGFWNCLLLFATGVFTYFIFSKRQWILLPLVLAAALAAPFLSSWNTYGNLVFSQYATYLSLFSFIGILTPLALSALGLAAAFLFRVALRPRGEAEPLHPLLQWTSFIDRQALSSRIAAGAACLVFLAAAFVWANALYGNPVSSLIAEGKMKAYLTEKYGGYNLAYGTTLFRGGSYIAEVTSSADPDLHFTLTCCQPGGVTDTFMSEVASGLNRLTRLQQDCCKLITTVIKQKYYHQVLWVDISPQGNVKLLESKVLSGLTALDGKDTPYFALQITMESFPFSPEEVTKRLTDCYDLLKSCGLVFDKYNLSCGLDGSEGSITGVTPENIESGGLMELIIGTMVNPGASTIVYQTNQG